MKETMKKEIDKRYEEIFRNLYVNWKLKLKNKQEELVAIGLNSSGAGVTSIYSLIEKLVYDTIENLDKMIADIKNEFKTKIPLKYLKQYLEKSEKAIYNHIDKMEKEILNQYDKVLFNDSNNSKINNLKGNVRAKLARIYDKNKNLHEFKRIEWLVIINTIATIGGFILSIISLVITCK